MSPAAALIVSAVSVMIGTIAFTAQAPSRAIRPDPEATAAAGRFGALSSPGVRSLVLTSLPAGIGIGICEVTLPAFSDAEGSRELAGVLLAVWSLGSAAGGLAFGAWHRGARRCSACTSRSPRCSRSRCCRSPPRRRSR